MRRVAEKRIAKAGAWSPYQRLILRTRGSFEAELIHGELQVFPGLFLLGGVAEQVGRVIRHDELRAACLVQASAQAGEGRFASKKVGCSRRAQGDNYLRADDFDLAEEELRAGVGLLRLGDAVLRRTALDDVGDVDLSAFQAHGGNHVVEELAGAAYEGKALHVFVCARAFADEHEAGVGVAIAEDDGVPALKSEWAAGAISNVFADGLERSGEIGVGNGYWRRGFAGGDGWQIGRAS